jgi:Ca2+-binding EF-hand superfamily protein
MALRIVLAVLTGLGLVCSAAVIMVPAQAQTQTPQGVEISRLFKTIDTDNDGTLSLAEVKNYASAHFDGLDADHDGTLTLAEFQAPVLAAFGRAEGARRQRLERALTRRETLFKAMDKDKDGTLSKDEYLAEIEARYTKADADRDGTLTVEELRTPAGRTLAALLRH